MSKKTEPARPEARLPKGFSDISASEIRATEKMLGTIKRVFESYGFEPLDTPAIEYSDALGKFLPDQDRPNEGVFSFQDDDDQWLSLRYDLTAPLARHVAANYGKQPKPYFRRYQVGPVWRNEKPGPGRFRQFTQFDADIVGSSSMAADAELCMLAADTLEKLGVKRGGYIVKFANSRASYNIKVGSRKVLDGVLETIGLGSHAQAGKRLAVLRAIDKLDRLGTEGVRALLGYGRKDESGDFTKGAGLEEQGIETILGFVSPNAFLSSNAIEESSLKRPTGHSTSKSVALWEPADNSVSRYNIHLDTSLILNNWSNLVWSSEIGQKGVEELDTMHSLLKKVGYEKRVTFDASVVRGLEYYTGPVFEAELDSPITDERGQTIRLGSIISGGRYDGLVERFTGQKVPATGISIGVSRLLFGLQHIGRYQATTTQGPVFVLVLDRDRIDYYQQLASKLRKARIPTEVYLGESGITAQMRYADRRRSPCVIIQGSNEYSNPSGPLVLIKDLAEGARLSAEIADSVTWREQRPGQVCVPEQEMVSVVKDVLRRRKILSHHKL